MGQIKEAIFRHWNCDLALFMKMSMETYSNRYFYGDVGLLALIPLHLTITIA